VARRRPTGQVVVEQARQITSLGGLLEAAPLDIIRDGGSSALHLVAWLDDKVIGIAEMVSRVDATLIRRLWAAPGARHAEVLTALLKASLKAARARGARRIYFYGKHDEAMASEAGFSPCRDRSGSNDSEFEWLDALKPVPARDGTGPPILWTLNLLADQAIYG
jgi:hypothetical protein